MPCNSIEVQRIAKRAFNIRSKIRVKISEKKTHFLIEESFTVHRKMEAGCDFWEDQIVLCRKLGGRIFSGDLVHIGDTNAYTYTELR